MGIDFPGVYFFSRAWASIFRKTCESLKKYCVCLQNKYRNVGSAKNRQLNPELWGPNVDLLCWFFQATAWTRAWRFKPGEMPVFSGIGFPEGFIFQRFPARPSVFTETCEQLKSIPVRLQWKSQNFGSAKIDKYSGRYESLMWIFYADFSISGLIPRMWGIRTTLIPICHGDWFPGSILFFTCLGEHF